MSKSWALLMAGVLTAAPFGVVGLDKGQLNALAFGVLVPMFGIGMNGLWASRHGLLPRKHAPALVAASWLFPPYPRSILTCRPMCYILSSGSKDESRRNPRSPRCPGEDRCRSGPRAFVPIAPSA